MIVPYKLRTGVFIYFDLINRSRVFDLLEFEFIYPFNNYGVSVVRDNKRYGVVDVSGSIIVPLIYDSILNISEGYILVIMNGKHGILNLKGRLIIPPMYEYLSNVKNELILFANEEDLQKDLVVNENIKYGYLSLQNEVVIEPQFTPAEDFSEGLAVVGRYLGLDENYDRIIKYGYIDTKGNVLIDFQYDFACSFNNGIATVVKNGVEFNIDVKGNITEKKPNSMEKEGGYPIKFIQKQLVETYLGNEGIIETYGFKDRSGKTIINPIYNFAKDFKDGLAEVTFENNTFYILPNGEELYQKQ